MVGEGPRLFYHRERATLFDYYPGRLEHDSHGLARSNLDGDLYSYFKVLGTPEAYRRGVRR